MAEPARRSGAGLNRLVPRVRTIAGLNRLVPRVRTMVLLSLAAGLGSVLLVGGYTTASFRPSTGDGEPGDAGRVPAAIRTGGSIIDTTRGTDTSYRLPEKTIALTFDDGPDPRWTPLVIDVLNKHQVDGTFFVLGERVTDQPDLVRRLVRDGHELGLHTFTHPDLARISLWQHDLELSLNQLAIAGATGTTTSLVRPPYSSGPGALDNRTWPVVRRAGQLGYLTVVADNDSRDWDERDVSTIVRNATPPARGGSIILWHDAGGNRSRTIAALDLFIPRMRALGYQFTTVSEGLRRTLAGRGAPGGAIATTQPASSGMVARGTAVLWVVRLAAGCFDLLWLTFVVVGGLTVARTVALFCFASHHARRRRGRNWSWSAAGQPPGGPAGQSLAGRITDPVSVIVPAYNEAAGIAPAVTSLATGDYPDIEVIVVDDGSTDGTADLVDRLELPNVRVLRTRNQGKPSALNTGIQAASHELIIMVDGDTVFEPTSVSELVQPFADERVGAVAGNVKIGNRGSMVARWQHIEYVIGFNLDRRLYDTLHCMPTVPGAIGAFRRAALRDVNGVSDDTLAEDTDLTMAICRAGWHVVYQESARAWTEAPATLGQLWRQRYRWSYGTMQAMWKHRSAIGDRTGFGLVGLPMLAVFGVFLPLLAPVLDVLTVYGAVLLNSRITLTAWLAMLGLQAVTAVFAFRLDKERLSVLWALPLQQFVYRQLMYLVAVKSIVTAVTGARLHWHKLRRTGLSLAELASRDGPAIREPEFR